MTRSNPIALLACLAVPTVVGGAEPVDVKPPQQKIIASASGRYVFGQISDFRSDQYLLDTQTGRLWLVVVDKENNKKLQPVPILQIAGGEAYLPDPLQTAEAHRAWVEKNAASSSDGN